MCSSHREKRVNGGGSYFLIQNMDMGRRHKNANVWEVQQFYDKVKNNFYENIWKKKPWNIERANAHSILFISLGASGHHIFFIYYFFALFLAYSMTGFEGFVHGFNLAAKVLILLITKRLTVIIHANILERSFFSISLLHFLISKPFFLKIIAFPSWNSATSSTFFFICLIF